MFPYSKKNIRWLNRCFGVSIIKITEICPEKNRIAFRITVFGKMNISFSNLHHGQWDGATEQPMVIIAARCSILTKQVDAIRLVSSCNNIGMIKNFRVDFV